MSEEQGSVLAGALGLCLVMTLAATGFLLIAGNSGKNDEWAFEEARLRNAAESGINIGVRWMRTHYHLYFDPDPLAPDQVISVGTNGYVQMEGYWVRIRLLRNPGFRTLEALATLGSGFDTCKLTAKIDTVEESTTTGYLSDVYLSTWQESFLPAN